MAKEPTFYDVIEMLEAMHKDIVHIKIKFNMIEGDILLDFNDVCQILHLSERKVRLLREEKKLTGFLLGTRRMYRYSEVQEYISRTERESRRDEAVATANESHN